MLKRKMLDTLKAWSAGSKKKALILLGARQTGKTFIVREFAKQAYDSFIEVNFLEDLQAGPFLSAAESAEDLTSRLSMISDGPFKGKTLVFFDEVQAQGKEAVTLSKFLLEDGRFDVILSGSLLGAELESVTSFPVGYAHVEYMHPLDFEEFCWACGVPEAVIATLEECYDSKTPVEESLHDRMRKLFRQYIVVGGMPEAVWAFVENRRDLGAARSVNADIFEQYRYDIAKYCNDRKLQVKAIYDAVPAQLSKENKRFKMMSIKKGATYERLHDDFAWLIAAGVALPTYVVTEPKSPLDATVVREKFKLFASDCGILLRQYPQIASMEILEGAGDGNYGAVYENVIAQELAAAGLPLLYYYSSKFGELDFLIEAKDGSVVALEVKSGKDYKRHSALNNVLKNAGYHISRAYVLSEFNVSVEMRDGKKVCYIPLYMAMFLKKEKSSNMEGMHLEEIAF